MPRARRKRMMSNSAARTALHLDVCARELILRHHKLLQIDVIRESHLGRVDAKDHALCLLIRQRELDLTINAAGPDERRIQRVDSVGRH